MLRKLVGDSRYSAEKKVIDDILGSEEISEDAKTNYLSDAFKSDGGIDDRELPSSSSGFGTGVSSSSGAAVGNVTVYLPVSIINSVYMCDGDVFSEAAQQVLGYDSIFQFVVPKGINKGAVTITNNTNTNSSSSSSSNDSGEYVDKNDKHTARIVMDAFGRMLYDATKGAVKFGSISIIDSKSILSTALAAPTTTNLTVAAAVRKFRKAIHPKVTICQLL